MSKKSILIILIGIVLLASFLRLWKLGKVPISPDWDEVALGYNAYSIMQTGHDEYGKFFPIVLRSFDDYKPAFYAYLVMPSIAIFGLNTFAVRLPSAIFGILAVIATYFLVKELFLLKFTSEESLRHTSEVFGWTPQRWAPLLTAFLLAISPWHIQFSRIAFESNVGLSFNIFSITFFLKGLKKPWFLAVSSFLMALNFYIYQSEKVFSPLLLFAMILIFRKDLFSVSKKYIFLSAIIGIFVAIPMVSYLAYNKNALGRAKGVSVFSETTKLIEDATKKLIVDREKNDLLGLMLDNRRIVFAKAVIAGYLSHFDLNWLFVTGDISRHHAPNMGLLYLFELPFLFIGIYYLIFGNFDKKTKFLILAWFLIAPIPASVTSGVPHAVRTLNFLPTFQIFTAIGIIQVFYFVRTLYLKLKAYDLRKYLLILGFTSYVLLTLINFSYYLNQYFVQQNYFNAKDWQYGYDETIKEIRKIESNYDKIVVSNREPMDQSYMFFLFYLKYPPFSYQKENKNASGGFAENHSFGKYEFRPILWSNEVKNGKILYVGRPIDFPPNIDIINAVFYPNGEKAILLVK
ncbi:MAG: glycosyltransferase family 39 protein [Candidatus Pacearchaeota archaeon]